MAPCGLVVLASLLLRGPDGQVAKVLQSCEGVRQGDPLAPLLFALSMKAIYGAVSEHGGGRVRLVAVHDDLTILGPPAQVARCHDLYKALTQEAGLSLQPRKSVALWVHGPLAQEHADWVRMAGVRLERNSIVLGSPVGGDVDQMRELAA